MWCSSSVSVAYQPRKGKTVSKQSKYGNPDEEQEAIRTLIALTIGRQQREHKLGELAVRSFHPKSHGTYKGVFRVLPEIPADLKVGLFSNPRAYDTLLRFSNGGLTQESSDAIPNVRGAALKLFGVKGSKLLPGEEESLEHDFIMSNDNIFFFSRLEYMIMLFQGKLKDLLAADPATIWRLLKAVFKLVGNPLKIEYQSQVAYKIGNFACKYALVPVGSPQGPRLPNFFDRHFLRHNAESTLKSQPARFKFCVQLRQQGESIEDPSRPWTGPFIPVAELTLVSGQLSLPACQDEALSFNVWRVLAEHEPLGWVGRTRKIIYAAGAKWRNGENEKQGYVATTDGAT